MPFLTLHEGNNFGRGLSVLHEDDPDIKELLNQMETSIIASVSRTETSVRTTGTSVPITKTFVPTTEKSVPKTKTYIPMAEAYVPTTVTSVPTTVTFVPRTDTPTLIGQSASSMQHHSNSRALVSTTSKFAASLAYLYRCGNVLG